MNGGDANRAGDATLRVLYTLWWEGVTTSGLIRNQVYEQLKTLAQTDRNVSLALLSGGAFLKTRLRDRLLDVPGAARFIPRGNIRNRADMGALRAELAAEGIRLITRDTLWAPNSFYISATALGRMTRGHTGWLAGLIRRERINVMHCRSYVATALALAARQRAGSLDCRIIFDTRGLLPEEAVLAGAFDEHSDDYRAWKALEQDLLDHSDAIVNVSEPFSEYVRTLTANPNVLTIPTSTSPAFFRTDRERIDTWRRRLDITSSGVMIYLGSLEPRGWHSTENLAFAFRAFSRAAGKSTLLVITESDAERVRSALCREGVGDGDIRVVRSHSPDDTAALLRLGHCAVLPLRSLDTACEKLIGSTMLASKTGEYLAAGLPILCHAHIGGAGRILSERNLGCLFLESEPVDALADRIRAVCNASDTMRERCRRAAQDFSAERNAERYLALYRRLSGGHAPDRTAGDMP